MVGGSSVISCFRDHQVLQCILSRTTSVICFMQLLGRQVELCGLQSGSIQKAMICNKCWEAFITYIVSYCRNEDLQAVKLRKEVAADQGDRQQV